MFALSHVPLTLLHAGRCEEAAARRCMGEAISAMETTGERWCEADVHRRAGEIELMAPAPDTAKAETFFERSRTVARKQQARAFERQ
jgi:predicted ATPase